MLVLAFFGYRFGQDFYNRFLIDLPAAYKDISPRFEMHRRGTYLGSRDHVAFCLCGPRKDEQDFDDWEAVAEMKIGDSNLISCLPQLARAPVLAFVRRSYNHA